jgi:hypothetical protein
MICGDATGGRSGPASGAQGLCRLSGDPGTDAAPARLAEAHALQPLLAGQLRHWAAGHRKHDGSIVMSRLRGALTLPFVAATQAVFALLVRFARDDALCLGYS